MMREVSPQGLTAQDFHHQAFIDPRDILLVKSRQSSRPGYRSFSPNNATVPYSSRRSSSSPLRLSCCGEDVSQNNARLPMIGCPLNPNIDDLISSPNGSKDLMPVQLADENVDDCDSCEDCIEDHKECDEDKIQCVDDCDQCLDEHDILCGQQGQVCTEMCDDCDFSCFDCVDWTAFEQDKSLGLSFSVPLLTQPDNIVMSDSFGANDGLSAVNPDVQLNDAPVAPLDLPMHHQCLQNFAPPWTTEAQGVSNFDFSCMSNQNQLTHRTSLGLPHSYGCHPATVHLGPSFNSQVSNGAFGSDYMNTSTTPQAATSITPFLPDLKPSHSWSESQTSKRCEWVMPCGTTCSASFATTADLKKHLKSVHITKGGAECRWQGCDAKFASEAALTGHVSKKHIATSTDDDGIFKCTFPGCSKSFMYKQVRDEHVASHNGNKMYCHICDQFLNSEGSNFRRHMASHRPKHQHMLCKHHHLGCKRRFPRLDNLRRHEGCCKYGKKAALHHHHHHRHVGH